MPLVGEFDKKRIPNFGQYVVAKRAEDLVPFDQRGQTCGIYALAAALKAYGIANVIETADHNFTVREKPTSATVQPGSMRRHAKDMKLTVIGELFCADDVVVLAKKYGHTAEVVVPNSIEFFRTICRAIDKNRLVMIPFSVDDNGHPDPSGGKDGAHWCLAIGYLSPGMPAPTILVTHWDKFFAFDAGKCRSSNSKLKNFAKAYYYKRFNGGINTYSDLDDVRKAYNKHFATFLTIEQFAKNWTAYTDTTVVKSVVAIPQVNLQLSLAGRLVIV